jgi:RNA polymerase sigma-70 factor (ECF subfamily)
LSDFSPSRGIQGKMGATLTLTDAQTTRTAPISADDLCRLYAQDVCRFAAMMAAPQDAEDLAQEALLRAVRGLGTFDPSRGSMGAWLWRIVANAARDAAGRRQRLRDLVIRVGVLAPRQSETVEETALSRMRDAELHAQIRLLPLRDRTLIALRYGAGLDAREVGDAVGLSAESASRALHRARARLRARLEETHP